MTTTTYPPKFSKKVSILSSVALNSRELPQLPTISPTVRTHSLTTPLLPRFSLVLPFIFVSYYEPCLKHTSRSSTKNKKHWRPFQLLQVSHEIQVSHGTKQDSWDLRRILRNVPDFWAFTYQLLFLCKHFGTDDVWKKKQLIRKY